MKLTKEILTLNLLLLCSLLLISCGGGGSSSSTITLLTETEPNETAATANTLSVNTSLLMATIGNAGVDTDYFAFTIDTIGLHTVNPSVQCTIDQQVWLYDTDGTTALVDAQDADNGIGPDNTEANCETIYYNFTAPGTYYLRVEELDLSTEGVYGIQINSLSFTIDEVEPNDTSTTASALTVGAAPFGASIGNGGLDTDYFSFTVGAIGDYTINPSVQCSFDQQVWLYDTDGTTALVDAQDADNGIGPDNTHTGCETIVYNFAAPGTYYLRVQELGQSVEGIYKVQVTTP